MFSRILAIALATAVLTAWSAPQTVAAEASPERWSLLLQQADSLFKERQPDSAMTVIQAALIEARARHGEVDSSVAMVMHRLVAFYQQLSRPETDSLYVVTLALWGKVPDANQLEMSKTLSNYGEFLYRHNRYSESVATLQKCAAIRENLLPQGHRDIGRVELKLALAYFYSGNPAVAREHFLKAIDNLIPSMPAAAVQLADAYHGLGMACYTMNQYDAAAAYYRQSMAIPVPLKTSSVNLFAMIHLAAVLADTKQHAVADSVLEGALEFLNFPTVSPTSVDEWAALAEILNVRGQVMQQTGRPADAESLFVQSLRIKEEKGVLDENETMRVRYNLAALYSDKGDYPAAESLYLRILSFRRENLGEVHRDIAYTLESLAQSYLRHGDYLAAFDSANTACNVRAALVNQPVALLSEEELLNFSKLLRTTSSFCVAVGMVSNLASTTRRGETAEVILNTKGFVSDAVFKRELGSATDGENDGRSRLVEAVGNSLPQNAALVEYYLHTIYDKAREVTDSAFAALVISRDRPLQIFSLGKAAPIENLVSRYLEHFQKVAEQGYMPTSKQKDEFVLTAKSLYQALVAPFASRLTNDQTLIIAPDGRLNLISFATLVGEDGHYLVESHTIHYLSAGRDLLRMKQPSGSGSGLLALGDPDYDASPVARLAQASAANLGTVIIKDGVTTRSIPSDCLDPDKLMVSRLPRTRDEITAVTKTWRTLSLGAEDVALGAAASEDFFKRKGPSERVLYLATHGFFLDSLCALGPASDSATAIRMQHATNPLLNSGLLLAGSNLCGRGASDAAIEDGILTAAEISDMNLRNTELVVLSACESGLGKVQEGEGVYGLRRAFLLAGARTVISALWKIDDKATAQMMGQLFADRQQGVAERIRSLQLAQIEKLRSEKRPDHPYSWGAFIATGDWR